MRWSKKVDFNLEAIYKSYRNITKVLDMNDVLTYTITLFLIHNRHKNETQCFTKYS